MRSPETGWALNQQNCYCIVARSSNRHTLSCVLCPVHTLFTIWSLCHTYTRFSGYVTSSIIAMVAPLNINPNPSRLHTHIHRRATPCLNTAAPGDPPSVYLSAFLRLPKRPLALETPSSIAFSALSVASRAVFLGGGGMKWGGQGRSAVVRVDGWIICSSVHPWSSLLQVAPRTLGLLLVQLLLGLVGGRLRFGLVGGWER